MLGEVFLPWRLTERSYIIGQIPSNMIIGKVRPSVYLCCMAMVWSGVSAATCGAKNYAGLVVVRFFLGLVEAPLFPGVRSDIAISL